jgi:hypothetical protein
MAKMDWQKADRNSKPKDDGSRKGRLEFRADRYLAAVDKAMEKNAARQRQKKGDRG